MARDKISSPTYTFGKINLDDICGNGYMVQIVSRISMGILLDQSVKDDNFLILIEIGVGFAAFGVTFIFLGVILFFDKGLLAIGNILFLAGLAFVVGLERTFRFFFQRHKGKALGDFLEENPMFAGLALIGMCGKCRFCNMLGSVYSVFVIPYGLMHFLFMCSGFFPVAVNFLRRMPVIGQILNLPFISGFVDRIGGDSKMNV
ncbi:vesicle transport protein GOT1B-like [Penaeus monodon]|uniref:vesicle transport protein GOT1B-like n=1 Tax=Penaeus monodon TaxID=6687 RepID=UPI0018A78CF1|nr:vesicle transport protein GOT1B-like [Penaeus monodon]